MARFVRILVAVCILSCVAGFAEQPALAEDTEPPVTYVAQIGSTKYATLQDALNHAGSDGVITLLSDIQLSETILFASSDYLDVYIDMNGHNITGDCTIFSISNRAGIYFINPLQTGGIIKSTSINQSAIVASGTGSGIILSDVNVVSINAVGVELSNGAVGDMKYGTIEGETYGVSCTCNSIFYFNGGTVHGETAYCIKDDSSEINYDYSTHRTEISEDQKTASVGGDAEVTIDGNWSILFEDLQGALDYAKGDDDNTRKIKLLNNIELTSTATIATESYIIVDLNGHQITGSGTLIENNSKWGAVIVDNAGQSVDITTTSTDVPAIKNYGVLYLDNINLSGGSECIEMHNTWHSASLTINNSTVACNTGAGVKCESGTIKITSGTVSGVPYAFCDADGALWTGYTLGESSGYITNTDTTVTVGIKHTLAVTSGANGSITTGSDGDYVEGAEINLSASPDAGYYFNGWTSSGGGTFKNAGSASTVFTMPDCATTVTAHFAKITYPLMITAGTGGSITAGSSASYPEGTKVSISASPDAGYYFSGWTSSGGGTFENANSISTAFTMPGNAAAVTANFAQISSGDNDVRHTISASAGEGGSISPSGRVSVAYGGSKAYSITTNDGYEIKDVLVDGVSVGAVGTYTFENVKKTHIIKAAFEKTKSTVQWKNSYADVTDKSWYYDAVGLVSEKRLMIGTSSNIFSPNSGMTRGMFVTVLYRLSGDTGSFTGSFTDVRPGEWYENAVAWAAKSGIAGGVGDNRFAPDAGITRQQLAVLLYNYAKYKGYDISVSEDTNILSYNDALNISDYAYPALRWACGAGIMNGDNGYLNPNGPATRAQVAAMLQRFVENVVD